MKIVAILGSPRPKSNTGIIVEKLLETAKSLGADTEIFELNKLEFRGCQACRACKIKTDRCVLKDDLLPALDAIRDADAVVLASPVYFGEVSGQFKLFFDRTYSFFNDDFSSRIKPGKKAALIMVQAQPDEAMFNDVMPRYNRWLQLYGFKLHTLRGVGMHDAGMAADNQELLDKAEDIARKLVG